MLKTQRLLDFFFQCVKIPSPSFQEEKITQFLYDFFLEKAGEVILDKKKSGSNLMVRFNGNPQKKGIILCAHLDTVEKGDMPISPILDGGMIWAQSETILGADNKATIAIFTEALLTAQEKNLDIRPVDLLFTFGEEKHLTGAQELDYNLLRFKEMVLMDATGDVGSIIVSSPTHYTFKITVVGKKAHAGIEPEKGINAIQNAVAILKLLPQGRLDENTTFNVGTIQGGEATNIIPDKVVFKGEFRSSSKEKIAQLMDFLVKLNLEDENMKLDLKRDYKGYEIILDNPFLKEISNVIKETNLPLQFLKSGGGSDANIFRDKGINAINLASGMKNPHSLEESITLDSLIQGCRLILNLLQKG